MKSKELNEIRLDGLKKVSYIIRVLNSCDTYNQIVIVKKWGRCVIGKYLNYKNKNKYSFKEQLNIKKIHDNFINILNEKIHIKELSLLD